MICNGSISFILLCLAGWMNREPQAVIKYLKEAVSVLLKRMPKKRISRERLFLGGVKSRLAQWLLTH